MNMEMVKIQTLLFMMFSIICACMYPTIAENNKKKIEFSQNLNDSDGQTLESSCNERKHRFLVFFHTRALVWNMIVESFCVISNNFVLLFLHVYCAISLLG